MKKILTLALCATVATASFAQKATVDAAKKLAGKVDKIEEARTLIQEAIANPETAKEADTYKVAGDIEWKAYDNQRYKLSLNPQDPKVDPLMMANNLLNGYKYYLQVLPLDSLPNAKGEIKPKYSKGIISDIAKKYDGFEQAAMVFYQNQQLFPEAYEAFYLAGEIPGMAMLGKNAPQVPDTIRATAFYNAAQCAFGSNPPHLREAAQGFKNARNLGYREGNNPYDIYLYELSCWQRALQDNPDDIEAKQNVRQLSEDGLKEYGPSQMIFMRNIIYPLLEDNKNDEAIALLNQYCAEYPTNGDVIGLRAYVNGRIGNEEASLADYLKAVEMPGVDYATLQNAADKLYRTGVEKFNTIDLGDRVARNDIKVNYFEKALNIAKQSKELYPSNTDVDRIIDNLEYALSEYFK